MKPGFYTISLISGGFKDVEVESSDNVFIYTKKGAIPICNIKHITNTTEKNYYMHTQGAYVEVTIKEST